MLNTSASVPVRRGAVLALAAGALGAVVLLAVMPGDVLAAVGGGGGNGATDGAKNFKKNGLSSVQAVGAVVFACVAIYAIAKGTAGGKVGQGVFAFSIACLGMAVSVSPEPVMNGIGGWFTGLFES